jgi:DNA mismatch repair protein MutS2
VFYPKAISNKLGFDQVIEACYLLCETEKGKSHLTRLKCSNSEETILLWLNQTNELKEIVEQGELSFPLHIDFDLRAENAKVRGFYYEEETIGEVKDLLYTLQRIITYSENRKDDYPNLYNIFSQIDLNFELIQEIEKVLDVDNQVKPNASKALQKIYSSINSAEKSVIRNSNKLFTNAKEKGLLAETELGIKNGRVVLPVLSEHKRKISGVLIDQSGTGKISYIEPLELVALNNELAELHIKKRQEIIQILKALTAKIVTNIYGLKAGVQKLGAFDFIRAKGRLAAEWNGVLPKIAKQTSVIKAVHPLLNSRLKAEGKELVPLSYDLNEDQRLMVISGPNAGGKSVALKTVGLLQYMLQSGFLVPCKSTSTFRIFEHIFIDIGDDQSIESDLSTYSSHLKAAKHIINFCDENTLVLMDEIGTGTDPMFGGPMAEAILEQIHDRNAYGVITTHFSNIKSKAKKLKAVVNAAMLFDIENLMPLYKLEIGQPGSSFVYEVAGNIGLNKKLIKRAKALTDTKQYDLDALLAEVQAQRDKLDKLIEGANTKAENASHFEKEYQDLKKLLETNKKDILTQAQAKADQIIKGANQEIEKTIRVIQESKADKKKTQQARKKLESKSVKEDGSEKEKSVTEFKVGDRVQIIGTTSVGEVLEIKKSNVSIQIGSLITKTKLSKIEKIGKKVEKAVKKYISSSSFNDRQASFSAEKDIRGMRTIDALSEIDQWIDSALILGFSRLRLVHGKGNGILKLEVRRHLKPNPAILSITYERVDLGGEGVSIIELK